MSDGELHQFPDTALGERVRHEVMITADTEHCITPYIEDTLSLSEDDPDDAFAVEEPFDAIPFTDLFDASVPMTLVFEPLQRVTLKPSTILDLALGESRDEW